MALAIVLSYARPQNIARIVSALEAASRVERILVSNNNPDAELAPRLPASPKLQFVQQSRHYGPTKRFELAAESGAGRFLCVDDDLFLDAGQADRLLEALERDPRAPHGVWGERYSRSHRELAIQLGVQRRDVRLGVLNRCYAFTAQHVRRFFELAALLGFAPGEEVRNADDILLSFSGDEAPLCHDFGPLEDCPSANAPGIALWRRDGFFEGRQQLLNRLLALPPDFTPWWRARMEAFHREAARA